jgi:hypothetical protein
MDNYWLFDLSPAKQQQNPTLQRDNSGSRLPESSRGRLGTRLLLQTGAAMMFSVRYRTRVDVFDKIHN